MDQSSRATSYHDLLRSFQQAENPCQTPRSKKLVYKGSQSKFSKANKENCPSKKQLQSLHEKTIVHKSEWIEEDVLK